MNGSATSLPLIATAIAVGLAGGTAARYLSRDHDAQKSPAGSSSATVAEVDASRNNPATAKPVTASPTPVTSAAALDSIFHSRSVDRLYQLALFLPRADVAEVEVLARYFCDPKTEENGGLCIRLVLARWAEIHPTASVAFCRSVRLRDNDAFGPLYTARDALVGHAFEAWGRVDYNAALAVADTPSNRVRAVVGLSSTDPQRAFVELESRGSFFRGQPYLPWHELMVRLGTIDPARLAALSPVFGESASTIIYSVVPSWARKDPSAAAAWLARQPPHSGLQYGVGYFLEGAEANGGPLDVLPDTLPAGLFRFTLRAALIEAEARRDLGSALTRTMAMPNGFERQVALTSAAQAAMAQDDWAAIMKIGKELNWRPRGAWELRARDLEGTGLPNY